MKKFPFIVFFLLFLTGCSFSPQRAERPSPSKTPPETLFQFAGPWNKELFESFYANQYPLPPNLPPLKGGIVPHHLLAGTIDATFFEQIKTQRPSVIVVIGPNHFSRGFGDIITTARNWKTPFGDVETNKEILPLLQKNHLVSLNEEVMKEEHSTYTIIPFIKKSLETATVVPLIIQPYAATTTLDAVVELLYKNLPSDAVIVGSVDFSHYKDLKTANKNDEITRATMKKFDYNALGSLDIDSPKSIYLILKLMQKFESTKIVHEIHSNSAILASDPNAKETTSYYSPYYGKNE
jgi:AmmeMemoRadiSam system protein B